MNLIFFDGSYRDHLLPLTYTRPVADLRVGILKIYEKWEYYLPGKSSFSTQDYLSKKYPLVTAEENILIKGSLLPDQSLANAIMKLEAGEALFSKGKLLAAKTGIYDPEDPSILDKGTEYTDEYKLIDYPWKIFKYNGEEIEKDYKLLTADRKSQALSPTVNVISPQNVFVEEGFQGEYFTLNASEGPIYLAKDSEIMEGSVIRGPFALGEHSIVKLGSKIYGPTTVGPHSRVGGEVNNSVIYGYSNKGHDGFLGNSVLGEWCNLGADTNNSNLKNNYAEVKLWSYPANRFVSTGLQFCGLIMGDHSKCGINTMFNTGTVVGVSANIFGAGFPRNFIPSFSWGGASKMIDYKVDKALETMKLVMERRDIDLSKEDKKIMEYIFEHTKKYRR